MSRTNITTFFVALILAYIVIEHAWDHQRLIVILIAMVLAIAVIGAAIFDARRDGKQTSVAELIALKPQGRGKFRVAVFSPLSGDLRSYGLTHARGIVAAILNTFQELCEEDLTGGLEERFEFRFIDSAPLSLPQLREQFLDVQDSGNYDVVFGPMRSEEAFHLFGDQNVPVEVKVTTILAAAATTRIEDHPEYGCKLLQLVPTIDVHARHLAMYCQVCVRPIPTFVVVLHRNDEYGTCTVSAVSEHASRVPTLKKTVDICYEAFSANAAFTQQAQALCDRVKAEIGRPSDEVLLILADAGDSLKFLKKALKATELRQARTLTFTSLKADSVNSGDLDGLYLICSYSPVAFSPNAPTFREYALKAQDELRRIKDFPFPSKWDRVEATDAEAHDAAVYWLANEVLPQFGLEQRRTKSLYVTNFRLLRENRKGKKVLVNEAALHLLQISRTHFDIVPIEMG